MNRLFRLTLVFIVFAFSVLAFSTNQASAQPADVLERQATQCTASGGIWDSNNGTCQLQLGDCTDFNQTLLGIPTWYKYLQPELVAGKCRPVVDSPMDILPVGIAVLEIALTLGGMVAVVMVFIGGFKYVLAQGEADKAAGGRKTVVNAIIGLVIAILATRVVSFIGNRLG